ncbi:ABC transporter permease [Dissulfurispira thermophila]|uniref:ABC transporter permease n=2 Tax=root TaxID=1 RepID=A0A7G1H2J1_9BACT|nr:FtsX-like permease family protein [Dissulfurispira thermophila]BCB97035.1 ABC transporter permease [Dissulfurispira thermophila]
MKLQRQRNIVDFTISSLMRKKGKNISLFVVYTLIVFMLGSVMFFTYAIRREAAFILQDAPDIVVQRMVAGRHDFMPLKYIDGIRKIKGVSEVKGRLWGYYFDPVAGANYTVMAVDKGIKIADVDMSQLHSKKSYDFSGDLYIDKGSIIIGSGISKVRLANIGDIMPFRSYEGKSLFFKIGGVFSSSSDLVASDLILISKEDFRILFGIKEDYVTDLMVGVRNKREINNIARKITEILPDARPIVRDEILRTYDSVFNWRSGIILTILFGAVMAFVIFAWDKASGLSAEERREIGILKAIGWEASDVIIMKFWEATVVSLTSFLLGVILSYAHVFFFNSYLFEPVLKGWSVLYPEFRLTPFIDFYQIITLFFLTVIPYTAATIIPSWRAATVEPDSVMR